MFFLVLIVVPAVIWRRGFFSCDTWEEEAKWRMWGGGGGVGVGLWRMLCNVSFLCVSCLTFGERTKWKCHQNSLEVKLCSI